MYSKQQASKIKQDFWTRFGQYMKPVLPAGGEKVNWSNYKTGIPHIYFRLRAEKNFASVSIELANGSAELRHQQFEQFRAMQAMLEAAMGQTLNWQKEVVDEYGKTMSCISLALPDVNIFREPDWPAIISFLKTSVIALDVFWEDARMVFE